MQKQVNFNNLEAAFHYKGNNELRFTYLIFRMLQHPALVRILTRAAEAVIRFNLPFREVIRRTIFKVFCSGESIGEAIESINNLKRHQVHAVLDYVSEGENNENAFIRNQQIILSNILKLSSEAPDNSISVKLSGLEDPSFFVRINNKLEEMSNDDRRRYNQLVERLRTIAETATARNIVIYIDAEDRDMQDVFDHLTEMLMENYNREKAIIYNTLQMYLVDRLEYLDGLMKRSEDKKYYPGIKLVRGAYAEKEREKAQKANKPSPVFDRKEDTDMAFNKAVDLCLRNHHRIYTCIASHNQYSTEFAVKCIEIYRIKDHREKVKFSQLFGMSDHLTFNLASSGYNSAKYMPYGEVQKAIPYLIRRAEENSSINTQVSEEVKRLRKEIFRRKMSGKKMATDKL